MELLHKYGYSLVFATIFLEQTGFPIPAAPILILAGAFSATGMLSFTAALIWASIGCFLGDLIWYQIGRRKGRGVLKTLCRLSLSPDSCVRKTETSFLRHGMNSLIFAKFVPGLNTIAPPMAGMVRSSFFSFLWRDLIGTLVYCGALLFAGFFFEKRVFEISEFLESVGRSFLLLILMVIALYVIIKFGRLKYLQKRLYKERISPEDLYSRIQAGELLTLVDLRSNIYENGLKLPGALQIHPDEIDQYVSRLDREKWIVMYCT
ncbi:MAG TPA: VTT domain-containing protein [Acidobacteriota bacterium]|jgi:membrane protein DedA with SNARE-associated domain|nr:VTT domain-containing protein [Acidobacteriota bacterium]